MSDAELQQLNMRFHCTQCGCCCRYEEGFVFVSTTDVKRISQYLKIPRSETIHQFCRWVPFGTVDHLSLREQKNRDCVFWQDGGCGVYPARPLQCRTYPFWNHILREPGGWERESRACPGIGVGRRWSSGEAAAALEQREGNPVMIRRAEGREG